MTFLQIVSDGAVIPLWALTFVFLLNAIKPLITKRWDNKTLEEKYNLLKTKFDSLSNLVEQRQLEHNAEINNLRSEMADAKAVYEQRITEITTSYWEERLKYTELFAKLSLLKTRLEKDDFQVFNKPNNDNG